MLIGAVLVPGRTSAQLVDRAMIASMPQGSVFVDVGIDQRGIAETSRMTTLADPFFVDEGVIHCGVPNLPALVPRTASIAYSAAIEPYVAALATHGHDAFDRHPGTRRRAAGARGKDRRPPTREGPRVGVTMGSWTRYMRCSVPLTTRTR